MHDHKNVMIFGEIIDGRLGTITKELLGCGRKLADDLNEELCAVLMGSSISHLAQESIAYGADRVYVVDDALLKGYQPDSYVLSLKKMIEQEMPRIVIIGQTAIGIDVSPRLAFKLNTVVVLDCIELSVDPGSKRLLQTKPVYGGKAVAIFTCESYPQIATVRPKSMEPAKREDSRQGKIIAVDGGLDESVVRTRILGKVTENTKGIKLEDAEVIIAGGRGIGSADGFREIEELADVLKGAVGATRSACDAGWAPTTVQIGLTGKIVAPRLYIAVGLSGSSQHMAGCSGSKNIVAINKDPRANIFKEATFGVVGDWKIIVPAFRRKVEELLLE